MNRINKSSFPLQQAGFSIIELMIALVLGLVLMGGAIQVFISSKKSYNLNEEMAWIQENAQFSVGFLAEDLRMAGYFGCASRASSTANVMNDDGDDWVTGFDKGLYGFDGDDPGFPTDEFPRPSTATLPNTVPETDVFTIHRADIDNSFQVKDHVVNSAVINIEGEHPFPQGTVVVVSDCHHAAIFQLTGNQSNKVNHNTGNSASPGNCTKKLGLPVTCSQQSAAYTYKDDAFVMRAVANAYYVDIASNGVPALFQRRLNLGGVSTLTEELVQGVENMQIQYGVDTSGDDSIPDRYLDADQISNSQWEDDVVTARVSLLLRSLTPLASEPQPFVYMGVTHTPTDNYVRRVFSVTVKLRNRGV
ncbi:MULTISPECIES: PilW family protein [unclassified Ketobacter]|uniref:PilW family protein n=1 Tax=unclassified Ketobacter TaxID=2639109 RepID=UPI000F292A2D|nr:MULTISPECIES: PilW family protein [unclassified Ketobacter]RLT88211.1 MAG: prepilin-type N-terminal cleavage/methylation domain-containing protein [Ketobacter sp. GenoA1]RLT94109.1 MAG: prepilin-type N-terminal cleavage/methylation domain-containing protein [Ketobacter sp.]